MIGNNIQSKKAIVLGADSNYMDKVETTIKSVCSHNRDIKFYIFNSDFPTEWFQLMNKRLAVLNSEIVNVKITDDTINHFNLPTSHLSSATYLRYFIPNFVSEKRVLYLDSDIVVTSCLTLLLKVPWMLIHSELFLIYLRVLRYLMLGFLLLIQICGVRKIFQKNSLI